MTPTAPRPCAAGRSCPALRETWRDGQLSRLRCDQCGFTCSAPAKPTRGTAIVLPPPSAAARSPRRGRVVMPSTTPLTRWIARNPRVRRPLVAIGLFALWGLAGGIAPPLELLLDSHP